MNFVLCGMMGSGKTRLGKRIAELSFRNWLDTDDVIVEKYGKISEIFEKFGETYFREKETETVKILCRLDGYVFSTGGGLVLKDENVRLLKTSGKILYLRAKKETLLSRLSGDTKRPLLQGRESLEEKIDRLLKERAPVYERVADVVLDVDGKSVEENAKRALELLQGVEK
ncbi:MAG: shikimate kinase [Clostridia bacterium]|nr:shikimate kinase [Clostridia bacterium]